MPIKLAQLSQSGDNKVFVAFKYPNPVPGFDHALVLLVEQDGAKDSWQTITRNETVGGLELNVLDFENASFPGGVNTSGPEDDVGGTGANRRMRLIPVVPGNSWTATLFQFAKWQPDTDPGADLEFYGVIALVAVAAGKPIAQLGPLVITSTLSISF